MLLVESRKAAQFAAPLFHLARTMTSIGLLLLPLLIAPPTEGFHLNSQASNLLRIRVGTSSHPRLNSPVKSPPSLLSSSSTTTVLFQTALEASVPPPESAVVIKLRKYATTFCNLFPVWTVLTAAVALSRPQTFLKIPSSTFPAQIGMLMLCMGITLRPSDFKRVAQRPGAVALAFVGCYGVVRRGRRHHYHRTRVFFARLDSTHTRLPFPQQLNHFGAYTY